MSARPHWGQMVVATVAVMVLPAVIVGALGALGVISGVWIGVALSAILALAATSLGSAYWRRRATGDALFSDLLLWGWLRRGRMERRLGRADDLLDQAGTADAERKAEILRDLGVALDAQDPYLDGHSRRVARYAAMTAQRMDLPDEQANRVRTAAMIHDIGKLRIPAAIVNKPGRLTDDEFERMKEHAAEGGRMVECLGDPALAAAVRGHHERWDGSGYPDGLRGERIPLEARIISVVDTFDAIASERSYRAATPHAKVLKIIDEEAGKQFDPDAARAFISCYSDRRGAAMWAAIASVPRQVAERLSVRPGEIAGLLGAAVTASLVVVAGAMAAQALSVTSDPSKDARARTAGGRCRRDAERADRVAKPEHSAGDGHGDSAGDDARSRRRARARAGRRRLAWSVSSPRATSPAPRPRPRHRPAARRSRRRPCRPSPPPHRRPSCQRSCRNSRRSRCSRCRCPSRPPSRPLSRLRRHWRRRRPSRPLSRRVRHWRATPPLRRSRPRHRSRSRRTPSPEPLPPLVANTLPVFPTTTPTPPTHSKDDCKDGGWKDLGYLNQGQCIADAERHGRRS